MSLAGSGRATLLVVAGMAGQEVGAALAVGLFPRSGALGAVLMRLVFSAIALGAVTRPKVRTFDAAQWRSVILFGLALAGMNACFYMSLRTLPLGVAVTIEVLGPLVLSIVASRRASAWVWAGLALAGVVALGGGGWDRLDPVGVLWALGAAVGWASYILASARVGARVSGLGGLAVAMAVGSVVMLPFGIADAGAALLHPEVLGIGFAVAMLSSMIPYALELIALRRLRASTFSILMSLGPATASTAGWLLLGQALSPVELAGVALVIAASIGAVRTAPKGAEPAGPTG